MVTVSQFLLGFRLVKRVTVAHRHAGDREGHEAEELRNDVPDVRRDSTMACMLNEPACITTPISDRPMNTS